MTIAADFAVLGVSGYNGYQFPPSVVCNCTLEPSYSADQRTILYVIYHFHYEWWVDAVGQNAPSGTDGASTTDAQLEAVRVQLMHEGADFQFATQGLGVIDVNRIAASPPVPASTQYPNQTPKHDLVWGPKPRKMTWESTNAKATKVSYDIDVALTNCPNQQDQKYILEFNFSIDWSVKDGYTSRTFKGFLRIPSVRGLNNPMALGDNADRYFTQNLPQTPTGYHRVTADRHLSDDKCRLDFTVVDAQWESTNYPPPRCVRVEASHTVHSPGPAYTNWSGSLEGTYEAVRAVSPGEFWTTFQALVSDRLAEVRKTAQAVVPTDLMISEPSIYGRGKGHFRLDYSFTFDGFPDGLLSTVGLWRPVPASGYDAWAKSMQDYNVWNPRGYSQLLFKNSDDAVVNICATKTKAVTPTEPVQGKRPSAPQQVRVLVATPKAEESYMSYYMDVVVRPRHATVELKTLPSGPVKYNPSATPLNSQDGYRPPYAASDPSVFQFRTNPSYVIELRGRALRAGYSITPPQLVSYQGQACIPAPGESDFFWTAVVKNVGVPIVAAQWRQTYRTADVPTAGAKPPLNPYLGGPSDGVQVFQRVPDGRLAGGGGDLKRITSK